MLIKLGEYLANSLRRWMPEPFVFALGLTVLVAGLSLLFTESNAYKVIDDWYKGFWLLLEFSMQMVLMLVTGYAIALSPSATKLVDRLATKVNSPTSVYLLVMIVGGLLVLISWGWVVLTAVLARELGKRVAGVDYAYLVACVYISSQPWVAGLSSSIPLLLNTPDNFLIKTELLDSQISVSETLGGWLNIGFIGVYFLMVPLLMWFLKPQSGSARQASEWHDPTEAVKNTIAEEAARLSHKTATPADKMNNSRWLQLVVAVAAFGYVVRHFYLQGFDINLNIMIFLFFSVGLVLHQTPMRYGIAMKRAASNVSGIIFQYPFYAGIMGIMMFGGLGAQISDWMAQGASIESLPFIAQMSGAIVNFAIPSAGGEWAVIGPALTETALKLSVDLPADQSQALVARVAMAVAYGETSTNLLQPFYLLVILPVMGAGLNIQARDVMGYLILPFIALTVATAMLVTWMPV
jgi:short-chain fatty acids transporter